NCVFQKPCLEEVLLTHTECRREDIAGCRRELLRRLVNMFMGVMEIKGVSKYRGEGIIKEVPSKIIPFMYLPEYRNKWDKALQSYKLLERIDQDTGIYHSVTHSYGMGLISSRDFVDLLHVKPYPGDILTTNSVSVEYSSCPPTPSCVRGYNNPCGYVCSPLPENPEHSKLVVFIQPQLGGMLPGSVVETALPNTLINLITETRAGLKGLKDHN
ncbi:PREDICTED: stAR-related lipid transfer protein 6, partial [Cariama cristata]|uniref:stAR-related lipid transfer protein 6 n=1 Tax=Cariama cristata TaxID=54380 RepID=UPI000520942F